MSDMQPCCSSDTVDTHLVPRVPLRRNNVTATVQAVAALIFPDTHTDQQLSARDLNSWVGQHTDICLCSCVSDTELQKELVNSANKSKDTGFVGDRSPNFTLLLLLLSARFGQYCVIHTDSVYNVVTVVWLSNTLLLMFCVNIVQQIAVNRGNLYLLCIRLLCSFLQMVNVWDNSTKQVLIKQGIFSNQQIRLLCCFL